MKNSWWEKKGGGLNTPVHGASSRRKNAFQLSARASARARGGNFGLNHAATPVNLAWSLTRKASRGAVIKFQTTLRQKPSNTRKKRSERAIGDSIREIFQGTNISIRRSLLRRPCKRCHWSCCSFLENFRPSILKNHGFVEDQRRKLLSTEIRSHWQARSIGRSKEQIFFRLFFALVPLCGKDSSYTRRGGSTLRDYSEIFGEKFSLWNSTERD